MEHFSRYRRLKVEEKPPHPLIKWKYVKRISASHEIILGFRTIEQRSLVRQCRSGGGCGVYEFVRAVYPEPPIS